MTIEERVEEAIAELETLLVDGREVEASVDEVAANFELTSEVVRLRAEKALGKLELVASNEARSRAHLCRRGKLRSATYEYCNEFYGAASRDRTAPELRDWLEVRLGEPLTSDEFQYATDEKEKAFCRFLDRTVNELIKNAEN